MESLLPIEDLLLVPLGFAVAAFGTLVGAGGGFILVPILLFLHPDRGPEEITSISLLVVFMNALSGTGAYARQRRIDIRSGLWFALGTLPGAVGGALMVNAVPRDLFDAVFAFVLGALALYLLFKSVGSVIRAPVTGAGVSRRFIRDSEGNTYVYAFHLWRGVVLSLGVGLFSSLLGIGGGVIHVPIMTALLHFPVHIAVATSQFVLAFMAAEATIVHVFAGNLGWDESLLEAGLLGIGAIPGAQAGAWIGQRTRGSIISRVLAVSLLVVSVRLGFEAFG